MGEVREYQTSSIRNVAVVGHSRCGKTSLVDTLAFVSGTVDRHGKVDDGSALTQFRAEEIAHQMSMYCTPAYAEWRDTKINLLDTPGYSDFLGELESAVRVADGAVVVVGGRSGVGHGTVEAWGELDRRNVPRVVFISKMDADGAHFHTTWKDVKARLSDKIIPVEIPIGEGTGFRGVINLFTGKAHVFESGQRDGAFEVTDVPDALRGEYEKWHAELQETLATTDESLLERYLEDEEISDEEFVAAMASAVARGEVIPVLCGSSENSIGIRALLDQMVDLLPSPKDGPHEVARKEGSDEEVHLTADDGGPLAALVFKTVSEPHVGELTWFHIVSGSIASGAEVYNATRDCTEKLAHLSVALGRHRREVDRLHAGDIGVAAKLRDSHTGDTFSERAPHLVLDPIPFPEPDTRIAIRGKTRADDDKLSEVLHKLHEEDPTFIASYDGELEQTIARGIGELHLRVQVEKLAERFGVEVETEQPRIAYRESFRRKSDAQGRHKKQTGGKGQFGDCRVRVYPTARGAGYEFQDKITGGVIPSKYIPAVDKGIQEAAQRGFLAGYPVVDFGVELYDGSYHAVDSSEMAFKIAGSLAFQEALKSADPFLLEPVMEVEVTCPPESMGDVSGDVSQRRGRILGMDQVGRNTVVHAVIPEAELFGYSAALRSLTSGRGHHTRAFAGYEEVPSHLQGSIVAGKKDSR